MKSGRPKVNKRKKNIYIYIYRSSAIGGAVSYFFPFSFSFRFRYSADSPTVKIIYPGKNNQPFAQFPRTTCILDKQMKCVSGGV